MKRATIGWAASSRTHGCEGRAGRRHATTDAGVLMLAL